LRLQAQTVPQAGSMLPETPAAPNYTLHAYYTVQIPDGHRYSCLRQAPFS
jgi:hypothetical protein